MGTVSIGMDEDLINYGKLIDDAMHIIVKKALEGVAAQKGLPGQHHFFISFLTRYPGVVLADRLCQKYPNEMTIVLQYQFDDLQVNDTSFSVGLSFDSIQERLTIPFASLTAFADPSVKFGLQFRFVEEDLAATSGADEAGKAKESVHSADVEKKDSDEKGLTAGNVITLDSFRKK